MLALFFFFHTIIEHHVQSPYDKLLPFTQRRRQFAYQNVRSLEIANAIKNRNKTKQANSSADCHTALVHAKCEQSSYCADGSDD